MDVDSGGTEWHHSWGSFAVRAHAHVPVPVCMAVCLYLCVSVCVNLGLHFWGASVGALVKRKCWPGQLILILYFLASLANIINILCCIISAISWVALYNLRRSTSDSIMTRCFMQLPAASVSGGEKHLINCRTNQKGGLVFFSTGQGVCRRRKAGGEGIRKKGGVGRRVRGMRLQLVRLLLHMQIMENVLEFLAKVNNMLIAQTRNTPALCGCVSQSVYVCVCE